MSNSVTVPSLWDDAKAANLDEPGLLLYRSNLLGADLRITNFGGGNTSAKVEMKDPLTGEPVTVLWVKGSGGDIGSMKLDGFATLYMDKLESLKGLYKSLDQEDAMVHALNHCTFDLNPRAPSIDTCLHGYVPYPHVDHVHSDAVIAIAASEDSERLTKEIFGDEMGYLPWQRPGIDLGIKLGEMAKNNPQFVGVVLGSHGLFTWGRHGEGMLRHDAAHHQQGRRLAGAQPREAGLQGGEGRVASRRGTPRRGAAPAAGDPRPHLEARAQDRPFRRFAGGAGVRQLQHAGAAGAARHLLPRPLPAHQDPPADRAA